MSNYIDTGADISRNRHKGAKGSVQAFENNHHLFANDEEIVFAIILEATRSKVIYGTTSKEIAARMGKALHAISGRLSALKAKGRIKGLGHYREGAEVLVATDGRAGLLALGGAA